MKKTRAFQLDMNVAQEFALGDYEKIINYVDQMQGELISTWQNGDSKTLEQMILMSRNIFNFWIESIAHNRFWTALIRCGSLIGTLETIQRLIYEKNMDLWLKKLIAQNNLSNKYFTDIILLLDAKGTITYNELNEILQLDSCTLKKFVNKAVNLELININKVGKYQIYSLADMGLRYARILSGKY